MSRTFTITFNAPCAWLTANIELHRRVRSERVKEWRGAALTACRAAKLPTGVTPVRIFLLVEYATRAAPVRDRLNLANTVKAVVDALGPSRKWKRKGVTHVTLGYGLLPDDSDKHVLDTDWAIVRMTETERAAHAPGYLGRVTVTITEVAS
jgi:hypothetical protein